jgi:hypothetical protein
MLTLCDFLIFFGDVKVILCDLTPKDFKVMIEHEV